MDKGGRSVFDRLDSLIRKRHRVIVAVWLLVLVLSTPLVLNFFSSVNFNVTSAGSLSAQNSESQKAQAILDAQFPSANTSAEPILVVFQSQNVYSDQVRNGLFSLNKTLGGDPGVSGYTGVTSVYSEEASLLEATVPVYLEQIAQGVGHVPPAEEQGAWDAAAKELADSAPALYASSPLFDVNSTSLYSLLSQLGPNSTAAQVKTSVSGLLLAESFNDYPYRLSETVTRNFVSPNNGTMIFELGFASAPTSATVQEVKTAVHGSSLAGLGTLYVTGGPVLLVDLSNSFKPALDNSVLPGLAISLLVAGLLFLSPVAALIPLMIGGVAIAVSLGSFYGLTVVIQHGQINFAVPFLMILTMLGLAVDYSVLQLRRTREERSRGRSMQESVSISVRWAGEAILTAGLTVAVAYVVLAVTKVPFFGAVGAGIAIGVTILLAASLTLLPSLELMLGDRMFWPNRATGGTASISARRGRLDGLTEKTIRHKVAVSAIIVLLSLGAFYVTYETPNSFDITKLIPNFESNQGLTVISNSLGGAVVSPTMVIVTFPSAIVHGTDQFNLTQLGYVQSLTATIARSEGVDGVKSVTEPYGSSFNYSDLSGLTAPVRAQYLAGMLLQVGKDNRTTLITVGLSASSQSPQAVAYLKGIEKAVAAVPLPPGSAVYFGGNTQSTIDTLSLINGVLPLVLLILALGVYFILLAQLRSVFTPLRLVFTILCSVAFALAVLAISFYYVMNVPVVSLAPLFVVVTMLGVGIDYDIFLVTRIREEAMNGKSDLDAIRTAIDKVWVTLFGLGLILSSVFASLFASGIALLGEIGVSVASAVMIDVGVVILFFVPSLMAIAQRYNWWPGRVREVGTEGVSDAAGT